MMKKEIIQIVNDAFSLNAHEDDLALLLAEKINYLIVNDFNKLIYVLYRADINEKKLNLLLAENKKENAGKIIAALFIERQMQKIKSRQEHRRDQNNIPEEDRW